MWKKLRLKGSEANYNEKKVSRDNQSQNIWDELQLSCEITHNGKSLTSVFQEFSASINKTFILGRRLDASLSFYGV